jgi:hypothetical protein
MRSKEGNIPNLTFFSFLLLLTPYYLLLTFYYEVNTYV